jgi:hypothetical protein
MKKLFTAQFGRYIGCLLLLSKVFLANQFLKLQNRFSWF